MGNQSKDENAAAENHSRDQDTRDASLAKTIAAAVAVALAQQKAEETHSITEAVAQQTKSIADVFQRQMEETRAQYKSFSRQVAHKTSILPLRSHPVQTVSE